jgi:hypothetical protein
MLLATADQPSQQSATEEQPQTDQPTPVCRDPFADRWKSIHALPASNYLLRIAPARRFASFGVNVSVNVLLKPGYVTILQFKE